EDKGVPFEEINIEKNEDAKTYLQSLGFQTVPVTVSGDEMIAGFAVDKLRELV
ncbi:NrdH-redoxin, partial [Bacillus thuringiensis]|nr:NrdH-redoxin [Bacillus thuringiensis]